MNTFTPEEINVLKAMFDRICDEAQDCKLCPLGMVTHNGAARSVQCLSDRIIERLREQIGGESK